MSTTRYVIWSHEHQGWWKPFRRGYTDRVVHAGRYAFPEALDIVQDANRYQPADDPAETAVIAPEEFFTEGIPQTTIR